MQHGSRTHTCGALRPESVGQPVTLMGWVDGRRDLGGLIFIDLRDRYGRTQIVFSPGDTSAEVVALAHGLRKEFVVSVRGTVRARPEENVNHELATGQIEVLAAELEILNRADTPPFPVEDPVEAKEDLRLKYRYLDLRRPSMQRNLILRHRLAQATRRYFDGHDFIEVETPVLTKSTPEGARDYLVPSRVNPGRFFALPQSPQLYKQLLMVSGFDRYFQIVKCFRDEDLRADRQPEFTQIDVEMSFVDEAQVQQMAEGLLAVLFTEGLGRTLELPLPRLPYAQAISRYGSDKPDLRFDLGFEDLTTAAASSGFKPFEDAVAAGGIVAGLRVPGQAAPGFSRKQLDELTEFVRAAGGAGIVMAKRTESGAESSISKATGPERLLSLIEPLGGEAGDLIFAMSGPAATVYQVLGLVRLRLAEQFKLIPAGKFSALWVTDFPLLEFDDEAGRYVALHHPFTSPKPEDVPLLDTDPLAVRARAYDIVLNGFEIGGGSIRIHDRAMQSRMFGLLGISPEEAQRKFGFLLDAFRFGAPPHGGIAFGFDRIAMIFAGVKSLRDVTAFPKTSSAQSLMDDAPSEVEPRQLAELHIALSLPTNAKRPALPPPAAAPTADAAAADLSYE